MDWTVLQQSDFYAGILRTATPLALAALGVVDDGADEPGMGIRFIYDDDNQRAEVEREVEHLMVSSLGPQIYARLHGTRNEKK